jgi:hypothetical protein
MRSLADPECITGHGGELYNLHAHMSVRCRTFASDHPSERPSRRAPTLAPIGGQTSPKAEPAPAGFPESCRGHLVARRGRSSSHTADRGNGRRTGVCRKRPRLCRQRTSIAELRTADKTVTTTGRGASVPASPGRLWCAIRVNRMSKKYAGAKQTENCSNCFNHLTHPNRPLFHDRSLTASAWGELRPSWGCAEGLKRHDLDVGL